MPNSTPTVKPNADPVHDQKGFAFTLSQLTQAAEQGDLKAQIKLGDCYLHGVGAQQDIMEGLRWYVKAAEQNKTVEQCVEGYCLDTNVVGFEKIAFEKFKKSATLGFVTAEYSLACCYGNAIGTAKNEILAFEYYRRAADQGHFVAQNNVAHYYQYGIGTPKDKKLAFKYYKMSADQGLAEAQNNLGYCYKHGIGTAKNERLAVVFYTKSAEQGNVIAQNNLASIVDNDKQVFQHCEKAAKQGGTADLNKLARCYQYGIGTVKDEKKAFGYYTRGAMQGDAAAQFNLGYCYAHSIGTAKDERVAVDWYRKAAEQGNASAQNNLGHCYEYGIGTPKDEKQAFEYYEKAAKQENAAAQSNLARSYLHGVGTTKDEKQSFEYFKKSAEHENASAQYNLAYCYEHGKGTAKNQTSAIEWYHRAAKNGLIDAQKKLNKFYCADLIPKTISENVLGDHAKNLVTKYQLNYSQALALCTPDVQSWLLFGFQHIALKEIGFITCSYLCLLPATEFRDDMPLISAKEGLERELEQNLSDTKSNANIYTKALNFLKLCKPSLPDKNTIRSQHFLNECKSLTTCPEDVKQLSNKLDFWVKRYDEDSKEKLPSANRFHDICKRYRLFFHTAAVAAEVEANDDENQNSSYEFLWDQACASHMSQPCYKTLHLELL